MISNDDLEDPTSKFRSKCWRLLNPKGQEKDLSWPFQPVLDLIHTLQNNPQVFPEDLLVESDRSAAVQASVRSVWPARIPHPNMERPDMWYRYVFILYCIDLYSTHIINFLISYIESPFCLCIAKRCLLQRHTHTHTITYTFRLASTDIGYILPT